MAEADKLGMERLLFFSDAVFAIAITLLALDIRLPVESDTLSNTELLFQIGNIWPKYLGYMLSFLLIGSLWIGHHTKFRYIRRFDNRLLFLNLLMLMGVAFIPFPTGLLSQHGDEVSTVFYAATIVVVGLCSTLIWAYATFRNRLVDADLSAADRRSGFTGPLIAPVIFLVSIAIAFINDDWARWLWVLVVPVSLLVR